MGINKEKSGALWKRFTSKGNVYYTGNFDGCKIIMFENKSDNPEAPSFDIKERILEEGVR